MFEVFLENEPCCLYIRFLSIGCFKKRYVDIIFMKSTMITITDWKYTQTLFIMKLDFLNKNHTKDTIKHMSHEIKRFFLPQINYYHYFWAADQPRARNYKYNLLHSLYPLSGHHLIQKHPILGTRYKVFYLYVYSIPKII